MCCMCVFADSNSKKVISIWPCSTTHSTTQENNRKRWQYIYIYFYAYHNGIITSVYVYYIMDFEADELTRTHISFSVSHRAKTFCYDREKYKYVLQRLLTHTHGRRKSICSNACKHELLNPLQPGWIVMELELGL